MAKPDETAVIFTSDPLDNPNHKDFPELIPSKTGADILGKEKHVKISNETESFVFLGVLL